MKALGSAAPLSAGLLLLSLVTLGCGEEPSSDNSNSPTATANVETATASQATEGSSPSPSHSQASETETATNSAAQATPTNSTAQATPTNSTAQATPTNSAAQATTSHPVTGTPSLLTPTAEDTGETPTNNSGSTATQAHSTPTNAAATPSATSSPGSVSPSEQTPLASTPTSAPQTPSPHETASEALSPTLGHSPTETATDDPTVAETPSPSEGPTATPSLAPTHTPAPTTKLCDIYVLNSDDPQSDVQDALIEAPIGGTVCLEAGTYNFYNQLELAQDGVTLRGAGREETILNFSGQIAGGNGLGITGDGCTIEGLQVLDTPGDGIRATDVDGITFREVGVVWSADESEDSGAYGLYPVGSSDVIIDQCYVKGARDAGIYVGQSNNILVVDSEVTGNVAGIEIENSSDAEVTRNNAHHNTGGVLVFNLPGLPIKNGARTKVHHNLIESNNAPNFAPEGNAVSIVPQGTGILVLATDDNEFHDNTINDNQSFGFAIIFYDEAVQGSHDDGEFDPYPERNYTHDNVFDNNGYDPADLARVFLLAFNAATGGSVGQTAPDQVWDGCENPELPEDAIIANCFEANLRVEAEELAPATYIDGDYCNQFANPSQDATEAVCAYQTLPPIDL